MKYLTHPLRVESEKLAFEADQALKKGDADQAQRLFATAAVKAAEVASMVPTQSARLRALLARNAVSLWYQASELDKAEQLCCSFLAQGSNLEEPGRQDLRNVLDLILRDRELVELTKADSSGVPIEVRLEGEEIARGVARLDLVQPREKEVSNIVTRLYEHESGKPYRMVGVPPNDVLNQFRMFTTTARAASYGIRVFLSRGPEFDQGISSEPKAIADLFFMLAAQARSSNQLGDSIEKLRPEYRYPLLMSFRKLLPDGNEVERVTISSPSRQSAREPLLFVAEDRPKVKPKREMERPVVGDQLIGRMVGFDVSSQVPYIRVVDNKGDIYTVYIEKSHFEPKTTKRYNEWIRIYIDQRHPLRSRHRLYARSIEPYRKGDSDTEK